MTETRLRVRAALDKWMAVVALLLVVLAAVGGWATYTSVVEPGTHTEERTVSSWSSTRSFTHGAQVVRENPVFPNGTVLSNRSVYFRTIAPVLNGTYQFTYHATEGGALDVTTETSLVIRNVETSEGGNTTVHWRVTDQLTQTSASKADPRTKVSVPFSLNVTRVQNRTNNISDALGDGPGKQQVLVQVDVELDGTVNGHDVARSFTDSLVLAFDGDTYRVKSTGDLAAKAQRTRTVDVPNEYGPLQKTGGPALLVVSLLGLGGLAYVRVQNRLELSPEERAYLDYRDDREEFDEWITRVQLPDGAATLDRAEAASLADLVDFAIDTDSAVIQHPDDETYYVTHDDYLYTYTPPATPASDRGIVEAEASDDE